ncbi:hypothetical protein [Serratia quinivorans]|uniref:hypothetical protein n=1 Tax=Serratia quinivorans TaxID=137545 RepID=UPI002E7A33DE|nr:hypothetical protein [Serratia quinivorans]
MMDIRDVIASPEYKTYSIEQLKGRSGELYSVRESLIDGLQAVGSLMFWASANDGFSDKDLRAEMEKIGIFINTNAKLLEAIIHQESEADFYIRGHEKCQSQQ